MSQTKRNKLLAGFALLILVVVIVGVTVASKPKSTDSLASNMSSSTTTNTSSNSTASTSNQNYKNGVYMATGSYDSPGGNEKLDVSLTLNNDVVTAANVQSGAQDPTAESYQTIFISGYKKYVVGKKINDIKISNVSGSSLTSQGFKNALQQIERQAEA